MIRSVMSAMCKDENGINLLNIVHNFGCLIFILFLFHSLYFELADAIFTYDNLTLDNLSFQTSL